MAVQAAGFDTRRVSDSQVEPCVNRSSKAEPTQGTAVILAGWVSTSSLLLRSSKDQHNMQQCLFRPSDWSLTHGLTHAWAFGLLVAGMFP